DFHVTGVQTCALPIYLSPMGCRTGFYLIKLGQASEAEVAQALIRALGKVLEAETVPARSPVQCGNYRDLSLFGAKEYARAVKERSEERRVGKDGEATW